MSVPSPSPAPSPVPPDPREPSWFPDPVFDPDAVLVRDADEERRAGERLTAALDEFAVSGPVPGPVPDVPARLRIAQMNRYACGPATAEMLIRLRGVTDLDGVPVDQDVLAGPEHLAVAVHGGTRWIHNVMAATLRRWLPGSDHVATPAPSAEQLRAIVAWSARRSRWLAAEVREVPGGSHLPGHPVDVELCHWFVIAGHDANTDEVVIVDPAASPHVPWADGVEPVSRIGVTEVAAMAAHHGVVW